MGRAPKISYQDELAKLKVRERELRERQVSELGKLVIGTGAADVLDTNTIAGALIFAVEAVKKEPAAAERFTKLGTEHFQKKPRKPGKAGAGGEGAGAGASDAE